VLFAGTGVVAWHYLSGMETGLMSLAALLTLLMVVQQRPRGFVLAAAALALLRPEGGIMAVLACGAMLLTLRPATWRQRLFLLLPLAALALQPLVNWLITGTFIASGNQSKSILGMVPFIPEVVIDRIGTNLARTWRDFFTGQDAEYGSFLPLLNAPLALVGLLLALRRPAWRTMGLLLILWALAVTAAVATLDTAFWHFRRYQLPIMALFFPLLMLPLAAGWRVIANSRRRYSLSLVLLVGAGIVLAASSRQFLAYYTLNVRYVVAQPLSMARWLAAHTPPAAVVAVHDAGMMRYMGGRTTLDIVGLTTPGAADYWRNGPGSVAEFLMRRQPDYIASYGDGHGYGLALIADTSLYGEPLAGFPVALAAGSNVALAAPFQGIYQPNYAPQARRETALQTSIQPYLDGFRLVAAVNVADVASEREYAYRWQNSRAPQGFPTDVYEIAYVNCAADCRLRDGGRRINHEEAFTVPVTPGQAVILVTRVNAMHRVEYNVYADEQFVGTRFVPQERGRWLEIPTLIPAALVTDSTLTLRIRVNSPDGDYMPYYHLLYQGDYAVPAPPAAPLVQFQDGALLLADLVQRLEGRTLQLDVTWFTGQGARGDYAIFVHAYAGDGSQPQVAQTDVRPGGNALPPGNWLPGYLRDTISVNLAALPAGTYRLALGLYDPVTFARLTPASLAGQLPVSADGRVWLREVELKP
jgi:hypothetical protein